MVYRTEECRTTKQESLKKKGQENVSKVKEPKQEVVRLQKACKFKRSCFGDKEDSAAASTILLLACVTVTKVYDKLSMLNKVYEQELVARSVDMMAIKADIEKRFAKQKQGRGKKDEERKDETEKEDDQGKEMEEVKDDRVDMVIEVEEPEEVKVTDEVTENKKGRKRREERVIPRKRSKWKKVVFVVKDDEDKREKEEEKELAISYANMRTSVEELWRREKTREEKNIGGVEYGHFFSARL
ncbi:vicilin-like seed storage protein At2g18540 [Asparagus officinalis]|uniref:vicilin-like seed storage protein At2g18540 n=1 Tax=Asparagus officinalis TaxID=4686 RepID=UPI00098E826F|nr:vicilin-like seed storage protein At2g18540 [Asparagus officinalis]